MNKVSTMRILLLFLIIHAVSMTLPAQESRNGYWLPVRDTLRIFLVYAELANDPDEPGIYNGWKPGELPPNPESLFDHQLLPGQKPGGRLTKYFHQASFGEYVVLADHFPEIVSIDFKEVRGNGLDNALDIVLKGDNKDIITARGYSVNRGDFDRLSTGSGYGRANQQKPDSLVDMVMVIWRVNSKMTTSANAGYCVPAIRKQTFKNMKGMNSYSTFLNKGISNYAIVRHEFSHLLLGGNNFHSGGAGAGSKTFMSSAGGYAMISSWDRFSQVYSGFDRRRLGWKHPENAYQISARDPITDKEIPTDLVYGQEFQKERNEFILGDFVNTGDAIRIELPYLRSESDKINRQWLWIENHQQLPGNFDHAGAFRKGVSAYIQVEKENLTGAAVFGGNGNYTWPLSAFGNYDYRIDEEAERSAVSDEQANPFTGYNNLIFGAYDLKEKDGIIYRDESFLSKNLIVNGKFLDSSNFSIHNYPLFGTSLDAFQVGDRIAIDENPAAVPLMTHLTSGSNRSMPGKPANYDNRIIHLNGISVELTGQREDGSIRIKIRWDQQTVASDVRWCGDIRLHEELFLGKKTNLLLDLGRTPQKPIEPLVFNGEKIFSEPSRFVLEKGSKLVLSKGSSMVISNLSSLLLMPGSELEMEPRSAIIINDSCSIQVSEGSKIFGRGKIILEKGGIRDFETGSAIEVKIKE